MNASSAVLDVDGRAELAFAAVERERAHGPDEGDLARSSLARREAPSRASATTVGGIVFAGKYCGTAAMSNDDTVVRRSSSGELSSIGSVSSRLERSDAAGVTTSRSSLTTRTASWPARQTTMPRSSGTSSTPRNSAGQSSAAPSLASSSLPVRESARTWPVRPVTPGTSSNFSMPSPAKSAVTV